MLSVILLRLLAKSPADGYQTVQGLMADLRRCQATLTAENTIAPFTPGLQERFSTSFRPETLFTQHPQARVLLTTLDAVNRTGTQSLVMLSGAPGSGKSAIIASALKPCSTDRFCWQPARPINIRLPHLMPQSPQRFARSRCICWDCQPWS